MKSASSEFTINCTAKQREINAEWMTEIREIHVNARNCSQPQVLDMMNKDLEALRADFNGDGEALMRTLSKPRRAGSKDSHADNMRATLVPVVDWSSCVAALKSSKKDVDWKNSVKPCGLPWHLVPYEQNGAHTIKETKAREVAASRFATARNLNVPLKMSVSNLDNIKNGTQFINNLHRVSAPDELHSLTLSVGKALGKFKSKGDDKELVELLPVLFSLPCEFRN